MNKKRTAPYGAWESTVTTDLVAGQTIGLSSLKADQGALYWLEARPSESGRSVLVRRGTDGKIRDLTPPPLNIASRVHEYGGGAYEVSDGRIVFSDKLTGAVWLIDGDAPARQITAVDGCRYADFAFDPIRGRVLAVREDHRVKPGVTQKEPKAAIVALDITGRMPPAENAGQVLVDGHDFLAAPRLSPDGKTLVWLSWDHPDMPWDGTRLWLAPIDRTAKAETARLVAGAIPEAIVQPIWSPEGVLHFSSDRNGWWNLYAVRDGGIRPIARVENDIGGPHWVFGQRHFAFLRDGGIVAALVDRGIRRAVLIEAGRIRPLDIGPVLECPVPLSNGPSGDGLAYVATPTTAPPAIVRLAALDGTPEPIKASAPAILAAADVSIGEPFTFPARDGGKGHAFWYPPTNSSFEAPTGEKPPLIVISHGGPTAMSTNGFSPMIQWWTSRGIAVVDVNYGGSTGFGRDYRQRLIGRWGIVDVEDCANAAEYLAKEGLVDEARIAIRGGSAGGFTTLAALTTTRLFKAGASHYGVADLMLLASDTHKFESRYLDRLVGPLPQAAAVYRERSPIHHLDRLACPVIFFQGLDDKVVPPNQAETMALAMAAKGLAVAHYTFEGEGHGFRQGSTIRRVLELELGFYGRIFGFDPPGLSEKVEIRNLG
ncbi:peptidase [Aliidongia dinghuensis]|uniref:Peptidase n=1 Tax=Aliidongia dinghuensis TaxID=1867774 RepID=A0A8J2YPK4_9PROT|nr:prolyl oligopeptidase family serine peptidase [Aliidongia dinghuensis]GGF01775.1 peptidase [Aliidongia dinghuensis]